MTLSDLDWLSKIFDDTKHRAASLRQQSYLSRKPPTIVSTGSFCAIHLKSTEHQFLQYYLKLELFMYLNNQPVLQRTSCMVTRTCGCMSVIWNKNFFELLFAALAISYCSGFRSCLVMLRILFLIFISHFFYIQLCHSAGRRAWGSVIWNKQKLYFLRIFAKSSKKSLAFTLRKLLRRFLRHPVYTIRYDIVYLTCSKKLTGSQLSPPHGTNKKLKCETKNNRSGPVPLSW